MTRLALLVAAASLAAAYDFGIPANNLAGAGALAVIDPDEEACATAGDVVTYCVDFLPANAAATDSASCFCCDDATFLAPVYSSCEDYIVASAPEYTEDYSVVSIAQSLCLAASQEGFRCGGVAATTTGFAGVTQTGGGGSGNTIPSATATGTSASGAVQTFGGGGGGAATAEPPACTSFASMYSSCDAKVRGFETMDDAQAASCLCYVNGKFTTALDSYISVCGAWAKTGNPGEYESYVAVESFCELFQSGSSDATATDGGGGSSNTDASLTFNTNTDTNTATTTKTQHTVTVTPTPSPTTAKNAAAGPVQAGSGLAAWLAVVLPFVL